MILLAKIGVILILVSFCLYLLDKVIWNLFSINPDSSNIESQSIVGKRGQNFLGIKYDFTLNDREFSSKKILLMPSFLSTEEVHEIRDSLEVKVLKRIPSLSRPFSSKLRAAQDRQIFKIFAILFVLNIFVILLI